MVGGILCVRACRVSNLWGDALSPTLSLCTCNKKIETAGSLWIRQPTAIMSLIRPLSADEMPGDDEILVRARLVTDGKEFRLAVHTCLHVWEMSHYLAKEMRRMGWGRIIRTHANLPLTIGGVDVPNTMGVERIVRRLKGAHHVIHVHIIEQDTPLFGKTKRAIRKEAKRALRLLSSEDTQRSVHAIHFINSVRSSVPMEDPLVLSEPVLSEDITLMEAVEHVEAAQMLHALSHTLHGIVHPPTALLPTALLPTASTPTRIKHTMDEYQCM